MKTDGHLWKYLAQSLLEWEMFQTKVVQKIKTHTLWSIFFFPQKNRAVYEIMWKNIAQRGRPQMTIWRMRIACWITNATEWVTLDIFFYWKKSLHEHACLIRNDFTRRMWRKRGSTTKMEKPYMPTARSDSEQLLLPKHWDTKPIISPYRLSLSRIFSTNYFDLLPPR